MIATGVWNGDKTEITKMSEYSQHFAILHKGIVELARREGIECTDEISYKEIIALANNEPAKKATQTKFSGGITTQTGK